MLVFLQFVRKKKKTQIVYYNHLGFITTSAIKSWEGKKENVWVKNENDAVRNRISDFDKRRISQPKPQ